MAGAQEPAAGEGWARQDDAAQVHMAAPANTNVYVGNLPAEVGNALPVALTNCITGLLHSRGGALQLYIYGGSLSPEGAASRLFKSIQVLPVYEYFYTGLLCACRCQCSAPAAGLWRWACPVC